MATVGELTALYENFMLTPRSGTGVCTRCFNLTDAYDRCYACAHHPDALTAMAPISYSVGCEQLHHALGAYKRLDGTAARRLQAELAAVLWRFLEGHEACLVRATFDARGIADDNATVERFPVVTTVPSSDRVRDEAQPLRRIVAELAAPTRNRYQRLLVRSQRELPTRAFSPEKYDPVQSLRGEPVLLIDDTWTTGANAQSAAAALRAAGSGPVSAVVIGRHVNRDWGQNDRRLRTLPEFDWGVCPLCAERVAPRPRAAANASPGTVATHV